MITTRGTASKTIASLAGIVLMEVSILAIWNFLALVKKSASLEKLAEIVEERFGLATGSCRYCLSLPK